MLLKLGEVEFECFVNEDIENYIKIGFPSLKPNKKNYDLLEIHDGDTITQYKDCIFVTEEIIREFKYPFVYIFDYTSCESFIEADEDAEETN